jgi:[acyl-carrier-protein] S-malonyltransferase
VTIDPLRIAVAFPGQGTQRAGMARDFFEASAAARETFARASQALSLDVEALCFEADPRLELTEYAQPALVATEVAMLRACEAELGVRASRFGGHSLGEYTALVAAGVMSLEAAVTIVRERGRLMQEAMPIGEGAMIAVVQPGLNLDTLAARLVDVHVDVANVNSPDQVVLSGRKDDIDRAAGMLRTLPGFERARALPLKVSAPFHSRWMKPAEDRLRPLLEAQSTDWNAATASLVTCNFTGTMHENEAGRVADCLARQVSAPVRWLDNMRALAAHADRVVEIGPGKPLRAFFAAVGVDVVSVTTWNGARGAFAA